VYPIEHNGLTDASKTDQNHALGVQAIAQAIERNGGMIENRAPAREFRRR